MFKQEILYFFPSKSYTSLSIFCKKREKEKRDPFYDPLKKIPRKTRLRHCYFESTTVSHTGLKNTIQKNS